MSKLSISVILWIYFPMHACLNIFKLIDVFRESEAQTDPYTPEYVIEKENAPEVLTIAHLKYGKGLPASMAEMELIEQMREKRAFDNALPPTSDEACFTLRRKLMEEQEFREWNKREEDIKRI